MWGWGLNWIDVVLFVIFYSIGGFGIGVGFHRHLTHGSFKAKRWLRIALAVAGSIAIEGSPTQWVADHRRHHQFSDMEGDPHSPWRYGETFWGLTKGLWYSHIGWLFHREMSNQERFAPDLVADKDIRRVDQLFPWLVVASVVLCRPSSAAWSPGPGRARCRRCSGPSLVRIALLHHVTWSINSVCHVYGERPFDSRDKATNFWPLAILSFGENWHNLHHADPTCARHGVLRGQIDMNARLIWIFEKFGWVSQRPVAEAGPAAGQDGRAGQDDDWERGPLSAARQDRRQGRDGSSDADRPTRRPHGDDLSRSTATHPTESAVRARRPIARPPPPRSGCRRPSAASS